MADITLLPSAKVPLIYDGELTMTTEWYRFFWNIYGFTGTGVVPVNKGGTGLNIIGDHQLIIGNTNNVFEPASLSSASIAITYPAGFINLELGTSGVTPGTYGSASTVGVFTVNAYGVLTAASNTSIAIDANQIISGTIASARISGSYTGITGVGTLTAGTWNATTIGTVYGGTGLTSFTSGGALYATSTSALTSGTLPVTAGGTGQTSYTNGQLLIGNTTGNTLTKATLTAGSGVTITNGAGSITISATGTGGTVTSVSGTSPISVATGTTTPVISISQATTSTNGYLSSTDWNTFNNKQPAGTYVTSISIASSNGFTGTSSGGATPSLTLATSVTGILKGNGTAISAATSGTDYAPATSGTSILYGNGAGGFSNVTIGTGVSFAGGTLSATGSGGTVTSVSGTGSVNGITLTGTVTSSGSLTLGGTLSGIGNSQLTNSTISGVALGGNLFNLTAGTGVSFSAGTTYNGSAAITINATGTGGTVTSVAALTLGTTGTDLSSTVANSTTTPVITLNVPTASAANRGALSAADWTTFNSKAPGVTFTTNYIPYGQGTTTLNQSAGLQFDGTNFTTTGYATATSFRPSSSTIPTNGLYLPAANAIGLATNSTLRMYFTAGGSIGIGNTTVGARVTLSNDYTLGFQNAAGAMTGSSAGSWIVKGTDNNWYFDNFESAMVFRRAGYAETARIFQSGGVSIGNTTDPGAGNLTVAGIIYANTASLPTGLGAGEVVIAGSVNVNCIAQQAPSSSGNYFFQDFVCGTTEVGYIRSSNGTTLNYTSISDYRLKTNVQPMTRALETVSKLNPCTYNWLKDNSKGQGFIAHELQAVVPDCVTGEEDAVNDEGKPIYQGVDTSFLVATLTAAIQELNTKFDAYVASHP